MRRGPKTGRGSERGYEYDTVSGRYSDFIETEVLPLRQQAASASRFTKDPDGRATLGGSSGAAAAFTMAWFHPERYHRVVLYSPTFVNQQSPYDPANPHGAWEYHEHLIADAPKKPMRVWMEVGERDNGYQTPDASLSQLGDGGEPHRGCASRPRATITALSSPRMPAIPTTGSASRPWRRRWNMSGRATSPAENRPKARAARPA